MIRSKLNASVVVAANTGEFNMARILVVEDDAALRYDMSENLARWGHDVRVASDGRMGFDAIKLWQPDLVLSDINMPNDTGFDLVRRIKRLGSEHAEMAFLFISSRSSSKMIVEGLTVGADDYLTKPVDYNLLRAKVQAHLRKQEKALLLPTSSLSASVRDGTAFAATFAAGVLIFGLAALMIVYWIKSALGINIFEDVHFSDFFN